jgi:sugar (pentulose or hexulose) kinase
VGAGGFYGGGVAAKREDFVRATALSMTYEMARIFQQVRDQRHADSVVLGGGASQGACFQAYFAALFAPLPVYVTAEEDVAGLRGSLFAFSPRTATVKVRRVAPPPVGVARRIREGYPVYAELFERVLGRENVTPLQFTTKENP